MADRIVMGYWDCPACDSKGIRGTEHSCPFCARPRGKETRFYMKEGPVEYVEGHIVKGPDWLCEYCGSLNNAGMSVCDNCGASREESPGNYFDFKREKAEEHLPAKPQNEVENRPIDTSSSSKKRLFTTIGVVAAVILALLLLFIPRKEVYEVAGLSWEYNIAIEEYKTVSESDWTLPKDARLRYSQNEIRSYVSVLDHYEQVARTRQISVPNGGHYETYYSDNGDGTFTEHSNYVQDYTYETETYYESQPVYRQDPVYGTKYYYDIDKWIHTRDVCTSGNDKNTYWGEVVLKKNEREQSRTTSYLMTVVKKNKRKTVKLTESDWDNAEVGKKIEAKVSAGNIVSWEFAN